MIYDCVEQIAHGRDGCMIFATDITRKAGRSLAVAAVVLQSQLDDHRFGAFERLFER